MSLESWLAYPLHDIPYVLFAVIIGFSIHEWAHAYTAYRFGDPTAKNQGRMTWNPVSHIDLIGLIMIFIAGFGWAKPVPVNRFLLRNSKLAGVLISLAGPVSNLLIAFLFIFLWFLVNGMGWLDTISDSYYGILHELVDQTVNVNLVLFVFNLIPLPPLDGYRIIEDLVPQKTRTTLIRMENYGVFIFLLLAVTPLGNGVFSPLFNVAVPFLFDGIQAIVSPLWP